MKQILAQERTRLWSELTHELRIHRPSLYQKKADRIFTITRMLNKHTTDIAGYREGERCPDCELRDAASSAPYLVGKKNGNLDSHIRRHKWYGYKLSLGCEICQGRGRLIDKKKKDTGIRP